MVAALLDRAVRAPDDHTSGALAVLAWLSGDSDVRPVCGDELPVNPNRVAFEAQIAGRIASEGSGMVGGRRVLGDYAAGVVDGMLWAYGNEPVVPLI